MDILYVSSRILRATALFLDYGLLFIYLSVSLSFFSSLSSFNYSSKSSFCNNFRLVCATHNGCSWEKNQLLMWRASSTLATAIFMYYRRSVLLLFFMFVVYPVLCWCYCCYVALCCTCSALTGRRYTSCYTCRAVEITGSQRGLRFNKLHALLSFSRSLFFTLHYKSSFFFVLVPVELEKERRGGGWEIFRRAGHAPEIHTLNALRRYNILYIIYTIYIYDHFAQQCCPSCGRDRQNTHKTLSNEIQLADRPIRRISFVDNTPRHSYTPPPAKPPLFRCALYLKVLLRVRKVAPSSV
jgi:hypothetical protein